MTTAPTDPKTRVKTSYVVLRVAASTGSAPETTDSKPSAFQYITTLDAASSSDAIRQAAGKQEGSYIAVPARSFTPVKVTVTQQTIVRLD